MVRRREGKVVDFDCARSGPGRTHYQPPLRRGYLVEVAGGLCMPHSPRWHDGRLWVLESGRGGLGVVDLERGRVDEVVTLPGFTRGLGFAGPYAFVGLSQVREHLFDGLPLTAEGSERNSGVWAVDVRTGEVVAFLRFEDLVQELFEVTLLAGIRFPELVEPGAGLVDSSYVVPDASLADFALRDATGPGGRA